MVTCLIIAIFELDSSFYKNVSYIQCTMSTSPPTDKGLFQRWMAAEGSKPFQALSTEPDSVYENIWNAWLESLQPTISPGSALALPVRRHWHEAQADDVVAFLRIRPGQRAHHQPERSLSAVTRRRYWRVLDRIYAFAVQQGWLQTSPVAQLHRSERPPAVEQLGHTLPLALWQRLPQHFAQSDSLQGARDRAVLLLLYELALAPEEVRMLRDEHLLDALEQPVAIASAQVPVLLHIDGVRKAQKRTLALPIPVGAALRAWWDHRQAFNADLGGWLFHSRKGGPLTIRALFHVASRVIHEAYAALPSDAQQWPLQRVGPQVLRNTAIVVWLQSGVPESEVVRRLGVENARALTRLQHKLPAHPAPAPPAPSKKAPARAAIPASAPPPAKPPAA